MPVSFARFRIRRQTTFSRIVQQTTNTPFVRYTCAPRHLQPRPRRWLPVKIDGLRNERRQTASGEALMSRSCVDRLHSTLSRSAGTPDTLFKHKGVSWATK